MAKKSARQKAIDNPASNYWRNKADKLWQEIVRLQWQGKCAYCGDTKYLNAHHLIDRGISGTRHSPPNGILLCPSHHKFNRRCSAHRGPVVFAAWLQKTYPKTWNWVQENWANQDEKNYKRAYNLLLLVKKGLTDAAR